MAKKETHFTTPTKEEIMLIQPNNVTFGQYNISEWQENILTLINDKLQKHMTREADFSKDLFGQPYIEITCDEAGGRNNKAKVIEEALDLTKKHFSFRWLHPKIHKTIETTGVLITNVHNIKGTNQITININPWAIPVLLYYGVGVGGTRYGKSLALTIRGNHAKRLYKIIYSQQDKSEYYYAIDKFKKDFGISDKADNYYISKKILEPAKKRIKESGSPVWFDFEMIAKSPIKGRKPKADTIVLYIKTLHPKEAGGEQHEIYSYVYRWMTWCYPTGNSKPFDITEKLTNTGRLMDVYKRAIYYEDKVSTGAMTREHAQNSLKKMLFDEYAIK